MECWLKAKMYLIGNGNFISYVEDFVRLTRKCHSFINRGANDYELTELKNTKQEIERVRRNYNFALRYLGEEFSFSKTAEIADNALRVISAAIFEKTPRIPNKSSKKEKRQAQAKLNRSYGRCKNR